MNTDDTLMMLASAPATAYREFLYRPRGQLARWIDDKFEVVARPGRPIGQALHVGDVLLQVTLGRMGSGRCLVLGAGDPELAGSPRPLPAGQLLLRPRRRAEMSDPRPVEPTAAVAAEMGLRPPADTADDVAVEHEWGEYDPEDRTPLPVDTAAAVPPFDPAERAAIGEPLLSARGSAKAVSWNNSVHPDVSGVTLDVSSAEDSKFAITVVLRAQVIDGDVLIAEGSGYRRLTSSNGLFPSLGPKPTGSDAGRGSGSSSGAGALHDQLQPLIDQLLADGATQTDVDALLAEIPQGDATEGLATDAPDETPVTGDSDDPSPPRQEPA
jgi:hypothetical protein